MQPIAVLLTSLAAASSVAAQNCNKDGQKAVYADVQDHIGTVCAFLSGEYRKDEQRHTCVTDNAGVKWDFKIKYVGGGKKRNLPHGECLSGITKEATCNKGGHSKYGNWEYWSDPNAGKCTAY